MPARTTDKYFRCQLTSRANFADDLAAFRFRPDEGEIAFTPGQYATIVMEQPDGKLLQRPYSLVSSPHEPELEFFIELVEEGAMTPRIFALNEGTEVWIRKRIVGRFVVDQSEGIDAHVQVATVTGIAPYLSAIRKQIHDLETGALTTPQRFLVLHGASQSWEFGRYLSELQTLAAQYDWLEYVPTISRPWNDESWTGETGRVDDLIRGYMRHWNLDPNRIATYACGHPQMIDNAAGIFKRARVPKERIHDEKYF